MSASMSSSPRASMTVIPWSPIGPGDEHHVARLRRCGGQRHRPVQQPDPGRRDVAAVRLAPLDDLGVAGDDLHPGPRGRGGHRRDDPLQVRDREPLLQDEPARQVQRPRPAHRQVVDRAVHGEVADVAAREEQRRHDERVGREREPPGRRSSATRRPPAARAAGCGRRRGTPPRSACASPFRRRRATSVIRSSRIRGLRARALAIRSSTCSSRVRCSAPACARTASSAQFG